MKLLVVSHACVTPINQSFYAELAQVQGWDVSLVIPAYWNSEYESNMRVSRWKDFEGPIHAIPVWKPGHIPLHVYKSTMIGLLRKERPDAIYVHHEPYGLATAQVYLANASAGRCPIGFYAAQNIFKSYPIPFRWFEQSVLKHSSFCFPVTAGALEVLRQKGYSGAAQVLPLPVDLNTYCQNTAAAAAFRTELGIRDNEFVIGYLGRLVEEKGLATLMHALKDLPHKNWRCVLAGNGPYESNLKALARELKIENQVLFPGFLPHAQAPRVLSMFDVLVLPSETRPNWKEQFGRVIVEANACGVAVIGTNSGEIPNVLHATGGGLVVPEADAAALCRALTHLIEAPAARKQLAQTGAAAVRENYSQASLVSQFAAAIQSSLDRAN